MFLASVLYIWITVVVGITFADEGSKVKAKQLASDDGSSEYDLFYYDGESLRDEKWRFDPKTGSAVVSRRNGFLEKDDFHLIDTTLSATLDALGSFTKSYQMGSEEDVSHQRVNEPQINKEGDELSKESNTFSGVSFNTQYSSQNGYPHMSNVADVQQHNAPNNGLNFQHAFSTAGFGYEQHGSLFNQHTQFPSNPSATIQNNNNFQIPNFLFPFFNHYNPPNQQQTFGPFPFFGTFGQQVGTVQQTTVPNIDATTDTTLITLTPIVDVTQTATIATTTPTTTTSTTTPDPTLNIDIRLEKDKTDTTKENGTVTVETSTRRAIAGLPTSDEDDDDDDGDLDDRINTQVLKTLVG